MKKNRNLKQKLSYMRKNMKGFHLIGRKPLKISFAFSAFRASFAYFSLFPAFSKIKERPI